LAIVRVGLCFGEKFLAAILDALGNQIAQCDDVISRRLVGFEMPLGDSAATDETDRRVVSLGPGWSIVQLGCGNDFSRLSLQVLPCLLLRHEIAFHCETASGKNRLVNSMS
jgi:hypothetical protein